MTQLAPAVTRRTLLAGAAGAALSPALARGQRTLQRRERVLVVGAGVFGAWTATRLLSEGYRVELIDASAPGHARSSSGGETRMTRAVYGDAEIYARMAASSLPDWEQLSAAASTPLCHRTGVLMFFAGEHPYATASLDIHRRLGLRTQRLEPGELRRRFPQFAWDAVAFGLFEPSFGALLARRGIETLVSRFVAQGGVYRQAAVLAQPEISRLTAVRTSTGETVAAEHFVFACGPWLPQLFPDLLGPRILPTRQEVYFFSTPAGDVRFGPDRMPGWADFNNGDIAYGFPSIEGRGVKIAFDRHGPAFDPDGGDRLPSAEGLREARAYLGRRFPALADAKLVEARVCQYENSANGDLIIDRHPAQANVILVGAGSGHGFKHGPAVGRLAASLLDPSVRPEPRFTIASKPATRRRDVH